MRRGSHRAPAPALQHPLYEGNDDETLVTGEAVALDVRPTGFVLRAAGTIIDGALTIVLLVLGAIYLLPLLVNWLRDDSAALTAIVLSSVVLIVVGVPTVVEVLTQGKSLGRLAVGARIVRDDGGAIGFRHAFIRALTAVLEIYMTLGGLAAITALLNGRSKRLGDLIAGTYSRYERVAKEVVPVYGIPYELRGWALTADVGRMPDRLSRRISQFLRQAQKLNPATRHRLAYELAAEASVWVSPLPDVHPETLLAAVVVIRRDREYAALVLERDRLASLQPALGGLPHGFPDRQH